MTNPSSCPCMGLFRQSSLSISVPWAFSTWILFTCSLSQAFPGPVFQTWIPSPSSLQLSSTNCFQRSLPSLRTVNLPSDRCSTHQPDQSQTHHPLTNPLPFLVHLSLSTIF